MSNLITSLRQAIMADLATQFPDADVMGGERSGKAVERAKIAVFWPGFEEHDKVVVGKATLIVRYWPATPKVKDDAPSGVRDPGPLEEATWDLADFLQTKQTAYSATGAWFVRMVSCKPDYDPEEWGVEAVLTTMFTNPAVV